MITAPSLLEAHALHKAYPTASGMPLEVLRGVDLHVQPGEVVAIVGQSGTGKSTLLHILGGLDRPTSGEVLYRGASVFDQDDEALARFRNRSVGFVFQFHHLLPEFTALENVAMPALVQQKRLEAVTPRALQLLADLGLAERADHRPSALSGGEQQRVAVARALMNEPDLVLADEPTGNLDVQTAQALHEEMMRLSRAHQQAFVIATHNLALAAMADRVLRMDQGQLTVDPSPRAEAM